MKKLNKKSKLLVTIIAIALIVTIILCIYIFVKPDIPFLNKGEKINENFKFLVEEEAEEINSYDLFQEQMDISKDILNKYSKGKYTITNPLIVKNPYGNSPQTALVLFNTKNKEKVTVTLKGKHNDDLVTTFEASKDHYIPIYGLYQDYENKVIITTESGKSNTLTIKVDAIPKFGEIEVLTNNVKSSDGGFYFGTAAIGTASIAYDNYGEIRWHILDDYSKGMTMLKNGHLLISNNGVGPDINSTSGVVEIDIMGFIHREYEVDGGYHHDAFEMENGDLVLLSSDINGKTIEDAIIVIDRKTGKTKKQINMYDVVSKIDPNLIKENDISWGWLNGVYYDLPTNELILSMRNMNSIVAIDYNTAEIKWILGNIDNWSANFAPYILNGVGDNFTYTMGQHSPRIDENGNLTVFNNGYNAHKEQTVTCASLKNNASYAMVYKIDRTSHTAEVLYKFGGVEYFSYALSSYNPTYDGNMLFASGWNFTDDLDVNNPECTQFNVGKYESFIIEFDKNNEKLVELRVQESKFEVIKAYIYNLSLSSINPDKMNVIPNYEFNDNSYFTSNKKADEYETLTESEALNYKISENCPISFELINKQFALVGRVPEEYNFKVTFISTQGKAYRFTIKEAYKDPKLNIDLTPLPKGRYYVYVNMGDQVFDTRQYIELS